MEKTTETTFFFDEFEIDFLKRKLLKRGRIIHLKPKTFDLLLTLVERRGEVLSKNDLLDLVWANQFVEENNLTVHVAALRKALGERKGEHRFIVTVPGRGYRFVGELNVLNENEVVIESQKISRFTIEEQEEKRSAAQPDWLKTHRLAVGLITTILLLVVGIGGYVWYNRRKTNVLAASSVQNFSIKRLTTDGRATNAALSPDGKLFVYSHLDGADQSLWLGHVDGGAPVQLRPPAPIKYFGVKFTPDASSIYYALGDEQSREAIYKIPVFGGASEKIEDDVYNIAFAPDGRRFAFVRSDSARNKNILIVADAEGKNEIELAVSPDKMNFVRQSVAWSPDGSTIAVGASKNEASTSYGIFTVNVADGSIKALTTQDWSIITTAAWLADGSGLIAIAQKKDSLRKQLWFVAYPSGEVQHLITDLNIYGTIALAANQNALLTIQVQAQSNIWIAPVNDLSRAKQITFGSFGRMDGGYGVEWTADGRIVYTAEIDGNNTIWKMNSDGSEPKQLIPSDGNNSYPSLTADNRFVVFESNRTGKYAVWRANSDGSDLRQLTDADVAAQPHVSPDGRWIIYVSNYENSGELWRVSSSGGEPLKLADGASWARISPDSRFVACGYDIDGGTKIAILSIEGGEPIKLFDVPRLANLRLGVRWTPDGKAVTYRDWTNGIWRQDLDGGEPHRLKGLPNEKLYAYNWSSDGKWFAFTRGGEIRDVVLINNFR
ncbi:MAG: winged helix-turn-helix domain-containing protein [Pyrinomonadaceae bacterium]